MVYGRFGITDFLLINELYIWDFESNKFHIVKSDIIEKAKKF